MRVESRGPSPTGPPSPTTLGACADAEVVEVTASVARHVTPTRRDGRSLPMRFSWSFKAAELHRSAWGTGANLRNTCALAAALKYTLNHRHVRRGSFLHERATSAASGARGSPAGDPQGRVG